MVVLGHAEMFVQLLAHGSYGTVGDDSERGMNIHAGHEAFRGGAFLSDSLIQQADADDFAVLDERLGYGSAGPDLHCACALDLSADPLHELAHGEHDAAFLVQEIG